MANEHWSKGRLETGTRPDGTPLVCLEVVGEGVVVLSVTPQGEARCSLVRT